MTRIVVHPERWTGRGFYWPTPAGRLRWWLRGLLWPGYECANCIGMIEHGCECWYYGAIAPGAPPERWRVWARKVFEGVRW